MTAAAVECSKLAGQLKVRILFLACIVSPFAFAAAIVVQNTLPEDTLFGRSVRESGFALPLVVLGFAGLWALPALAGIVGGDLFPSEDRYGTWASVLTRSRSRTEIFVGKVATAIGASSLAFVALALSSVSAGVLIVGRQPLVTLSGVALPADQALTCVLFAWLTALPGLFAFTAIAVLVSVATRSSAAGTGLPVLAALVMQLCGFLDAPESARQFLLTTSFGAWHGLLTEAPYYRPVVHGTVVSAGCGALCLAIAYELVRGREIGG
jgi:ABC-2 type transport system permease protein